MSNVSHWRESARTAVEAFVDAAGTENSDRWDAYGFLASLTPGILAAAPLIEREEARALVTNLLPTMVANADIRGGMTEPATDLITLLLGSSDRRADIRVVRDMVWETIRERQQQQDQPPAVPNDVEVGEDGELSSMAEGGSREHGVARAPAGDNAVSRAPAGGNGVARAPEAGDNAVALPPAGDYSISGGHVASVRSADMPSEYSSLPSVVGRNDANDARNNIAIASAGNPIHDDDDSEAATRGDRAHSRVRDRGEESDSGHAPKRSSVHCVNSF